MKILFVSEYILEKEQGAKQLAMAHYSSFCSIVGKENVHVLALNLESDNIDIRFKCMKGYHNKYDKICNIIRGYPFFINKEIMKNILGLVEKEKYELIYFDNSYFGSVIKKLKKRYSNIPILAFYHGVKFNSGIQTIQYVKGGIRFLPKILNMIYNEYLTIKYADKQLLLNQRDADILYKYYKCNEVSLLSIYLNDTAIVRSFENLENSEFRILFLGGYFWPNIHGITWFAEKVMPNINCRGKLYIVGKGMEKLKEVPVIKCADNIIVIGGVDDLNYWYNSADVVVGPIFQGEGMKSKTAEALMYGKLYIGTHEALCGYIGLEKYHCETDSEFIKTINSYIEKGVKKYNPEMRVLYEKYYSQEAAMFTLNAVFKELNLNNM